jgi:indole-3-glycerol phosphate synthase
MSPVAAGDFLAAKAAAVRRRLAGRSAADDVAPRPDAASRSPVASLSAALRGGSQVAVMAEFKRRSPSAGPLAAGEDPAAVASGYRRAGAAALSVLTDADHFHGSLADLAAVAAAHPSCPVLCKDFIVHRSQLREAREAGAAAALLIVAMLRDHELGALLAAGADLGLECLVEVHSEDELDRAIAAGATLLGINNRDLRRLTTNLAVTDHLAPRAPDGVVVVSESGIRSPDDVRRVRDAGAHAVLVGEWLLRAPPAERRRRLAALAEVSR